MSRNMGLIIIFLALLPILMYLFIQPSPYMAPETLSISTVDKKELMDYSYQVLNDYFDETTDEILFPTLEDNTLNYNIIFITLLNNGTVRGCQSGSTERNNTNRIFLDIKEAITESIEDDRFGGMLQPQELPYTEVMFTFLYDIHWLYNKSLVFLQNNIELGVHSLEILHNDTPVIFKESVPISNNYNLETLLNRLCIKAGLPKDGYLADDVDLFRYETYTFKGTRDGDIIDLYRYGLLLDEHDITNELIIERIQSGYDWFMNNIDHQTGRLHYEYYPSLNSYSQENNNIRQLGTLWSLTELQKFLNVTTAENVINETLDYYISFMNFTAGDYVFLTINNESNLANNAFLLMSLLNSPKIANQSEYCTLLAEGILSLQQENGSFNTYFFSDRNTGTDYYPGEAMLSLMKMYEHTGDNRYLESVQNGFSYYPDYWRGNKNTAFIPWHTQTYRLLYEETGDPEIIDFIFEMNDWIIDSFQITESLYPDEIGGFPYYYPTFSTSVFLEGINDAYFVACDVDDMVHKEKYQDALVSGTRFVLQTQFTDENSFYVDNKTRTIGGFKTSLTNNAIRIDNVQHAVFCLMKTYENDLF